MSEKTELIQSSIDKWDKVRQDVLNKKKLDYVRKYWDECGYCDIADRACDVCSLYKTKDSLLKLKYCNGDSEDSSIASNALYYAKYKNYDESLKNIDILLKKMKKDLKRAEKKKDNFVMEVKE